MTSEEPPHQHHRGARRDAQQDAAGQVAPPQRYLEGFDAVDENHRAGAVAPADWQVQAERHLEIVHRIGTDERQE
jgi:hypothetical protein